MARPKADTKQKILAKAAAVFRDHGYAGTSIRMISSRAKVNSALINYYFGDKKTLYLEVVRFWAQDAFRGFPFEQLEDPETAPEEKVKCFIYHTLVCLFGPKGKGTGFGQLLVHEAALNPSDSVHEIVAETIGRPTKALTTAVEEISDIHDPVALRAYTACIVGQTVYFYLSRNLTGELLGVSDIRGDEDIRELSSRVYTFSMAALRGLRE